MLGTVSRNNICNLDPSDAIHIIVGRDQIGHRMTAFSLLACVGAKVALVVVHCRPGHFLPIASFRRLSLAGPASQSEN